MHKALLDTNVLFGQVLRDVLVRVAARRVYVACWSERILDELTDNYVEAGIGPRERIERTVGLLRSHFPHALVTGFEDLESRLALPDVDDRHVLAAAIAGRADAIVTANTADFPTTACAPHGIEAKHPDEFLTHHFELAPNVFIDVLTHLANTYRTPPNTLDDIIEHFQQHAQCPTFASAARRYLHAAPQAPTGPA